MKRKFNLAVIILLIVACSLFSISTLPGEVQAMSRKIPSFYKTETKHIDTIPSSKPVTIASSFVFNYLTIIFHQEEFNKEQSYSYQTSLIGRIWSETHTRTAHGEKIHTVAADTLAEEQTYDAEHTTTNSVTAWPERLDRLAQYVQLTVDNASNLTSITVTLTYDPPRSFSLQSAEVKTIENITYVTRSGWQCPDKNPDSDYNCNWPAWNPSYYPVSHFVIHHTATTNNATNWAEQVRAIWSYHAHSRGWTDIGYNYLIDPNGIIYQGRYGGEGVTAGHAYKHNRGTVGISLLGTYSEKNISSKARASLEKLLITLSVRYQLKPKEYDQDITGVKNYRISGHRDWGATECPGNSFYPSLGSIRNAVESGRAKRQSSIRKYDTCPSGTSYYTGKCRAYQMNKSSTATINNPDKIVTDRRGYAYVSSARGRQIVKYNPDFTQKWSYTMPASPTDIVLGKDGYLYASASDNAVYRVDAYGTGEKFATVESAPTAITRDSEGNLYVANAMSNSISKITRTGNVTRWVTTGRNPIAIAADKNDTIYTANYNDGTVTRVTKDSSLRHIDIGTALPNDIAIDKANNVFIASLGSSEITKITPSGSPTMFAQIGKKPNYLTVDIDGNVYVTHRYESYITKISSLGHVQQWNYTNGLFSLIRRSPDGKFFLLDYDMAQVKTMEVRVETDKWRLFSGAHENPTSESSLDNYLLKSVNSVIVYHNALFGKLFKE